MTSPQPARASEGDGSVYQGQRTYYAYNAAGERMRKTTISSTGVTLHEHFYLGGYEVYRRYASQGNVTLERHTLHAMDDKQRVSLVETITINTKAATKDLPSTAIRYQFTNHLGTVCLELDETGAVLTYEEYYPYGSTSYQAGKSAAEASRKRYRYTGKERDKETGLYYYGARYYAPWIARWASCDPLGIDGGFNLYGFSRSNPVRFVDPNGLQPGPAEVRDPESPKPAVKETEQPAESSNPHPDITWEQGNWYYTDENWNRSIYLPREEWQWKTGWVPIAGAQNTYALIGQWQKVQTGTWFPLTTEVIHVTGSPPKEKEDDWYSGWNLAKLGLELWSPAGKAKYLKWGIQFGMSWYESGSAWDAATDVTIKGVKDRAINTALKTLDKAGGILADYLGGKIRIPGGTNLAPVSARTSRSSLSRRALSLSSRHGTGNTSESRLAVQQSSRASSTRSPIRSRKMEAASNSTSRESKQVLRA